MCGVATLRYIKGDLMLVDTHNCRLVSLSQRRAMRLLLGGFCCLLFATFTRAQDQTFTVPGTSGRNWFDTGLEIPPGTLLRLSAAGEVNVGTGGGLYGPRGTTTFTEGSGYPAETRYRYGLVARLTARSTNPGESEDELYEQWAYGDAPGNRYCAARGGHLWLTVNDNSPGDNSGAFTVILSRGTCPSEADEARNRVNLYSADDRFSRPTRQFRVGDTIVLKVENNTGASIYLRQAREPARLITEEGLHVERLDGSRYVSVLPSGRSESRPDEVTKDNGDGTKGSTSIDNALTELIQLRSTMNITRRWKVLVPGSYRFTLAYYDSRDTQMTPHTMYSATFEVQ
jgi:hypothetical protein